MPTKKQYSIGDSTWIYGVGHENKLTEGRVVHKFILDGNDDVFYVIGVPTHIEDLLEVRTWASMSQDSTGPVGGFREGLENINLTKRYLNKVGVKLDILDLKDRELLHSEIENKTESFDLKSSSKKESHKHHRPKRRNFSRKSKQ